MDLADMAEFLEESLNGGIQYGSSWSDDYNVNIVNTSGGQEYRSLVHKFPVRTFDVTFMMDNISMWANLVNIYHRAHGKYAGFRAKCVDEFTSHQDGTSSPSPLDQLTLKLTSTSYQLIKRYGLDKTPGASGYPYRKIYKPVINTVVIAKNGVTLTSGQFSVDTTTGIVTIPTAVDGDTITAGFKFDFPVRFNSTLPIGQNKPMYRDISNIELIEVLNP